MYSHCGHINSRSVLRQHPRSEVFAVSPANPFQGRLATAQRQAARSWRSGHRRDVTRARQLASAGIRSVALSNWRWVAAHTRVLSKIRIQLSRSKLLLLRATMETRKRVSKQREEQNRRKLAATCVDAVSCIRQSHKLCVCFAYKKSRLILIELSGYHSIL